MRTVDGIIQDILFENERGTFTVASFAVDGDDDNVVRAVGSLPGVRPGEEVTLHGDWVDHETYGIQFSLTRFELVSSETKADVGALLAAASLPGGKSQDGPDIAERLVDTFGGDALAVLNHDPARLTELPGVGEKTAARIKSAWDAHNDKMWGSQTDLRGLVLYLQIHTGDASQAQRLYAAHGEQTLDILRDDPYAIACPSLPFPTVDPLASKLGVARNSAARVAAGVEHVLARAESQGHVYCATADIRVPLSELLALSTDVLDDGIQHATESGTVVIEGSRAYRARLHEADVLTASRLKSLASATVEITDDESEALRAKAEEDVEVSLSERQSEAVTTALRRRVMVLTGGPGTGKTTTVRAVVAAFHGRDFKVALCAPTGRGARRLSEVTGENAHTIHRLLGYSPDDGEFQRDARRPIDADVVIVDEFSMVDTVLFGDLLAAVPRGAHLVLVGDADQLPSVGPGGVLHDIIESGVAPIVALDEIFRQAQGSLIVRNAHAINRGELPSMTGDADRDCFFMERDDPQDAAQAVVDLCSTRLPSHYGLDPMVDIQVLAPMRRRELGTETLNERLQEALNPAGSPVTPKAVLRVGDKVMQIVNNYDKDVFNGDIGRIEGADPRKGTLAVRYPDRLVAYERGETGQLTLAYATTVHKSQGSEYKAVVLALHTQHHVMLQRQLLYTAVTRARELLVLVGSSAALAKAVANRRTSDRRTTLRLRLLGELDADDAARGEQ